MRERGWRWGGIVVLLLVPVAARDTGAMREAVVVGGHFKLEERCFGRVSGRSIGKK